MNSWLACDTPGIEVRPLIDATGEHHFNEVFFDNVEVPKNRLIGEKNRGWYQIASQLDYERSGIERLLSNYPLFQDAVRYAKEHGLTKDPLVRDSLSRLQIELDLGRSMVYKVAWYLTQKIVPNYEAAMAKCFCTEVEQRIAKAVSELLGDYAAPAAGLASCPLSRPRGPGISIRSGLHDPGRDEQYPAQYHCDPRPWSTAGVE